MKYYDEYTAISLLRKNCTILESRGKHLILENGSAGNKMLGVVSYLKKQHGYIIVFENYKGERE